MRKGKLEWFFALVLLESFPVSWFTLCISFILLLLTIIKIWYRNSNICIFIHVQLNNNKKRREKTSKNHSTIKEKLFDFHIQHSVEIWRLNIFTFTFCLENTNGYFVWFSYILFISYYCLSIREHSRPMLFVCYNVSIISTFVLFFFIIRPILFTSISSFIPNISFRLRFVLLHSQHW